MTPLKIFKNIKTSFLLLFVFVTISGYTQQNIGNLSDAEDPMQEALKNQFDSQNVGNLHVYTYTSDKAGNSYFSGELVSRGLYGLFDATWRNQWPEEFKAYATYAIKSNGPPVYLMRLSGNNMPEEIGLFAVEDGELRLISMLAKIWCDEFNCYQRESWIQDFNGDTELDILIKVRWMTKRGNEWDETRMVNRVYLQDNNGNFSLTEDLGINISNYRLNDISSFLDGIAPIK